MSFEICVILLRANHCDDLPVLVFVQLQSEFIDIKSGTVARLVAFIIIHQTAAATRTIGA